jgi:acyl-CoA thioesterase-1
MTTPMLEKLVRFQRPESALPFARHLDARTLAAIFGAGEDEYRSVVDDIDRRRLAAAERIAASPVAESHLQALPFEPGAHLVAIGESTTADRLSWFEILRTLIQTHRPDLDLRFTNLAASGATTAQVLSTLPGIRRHEPDWVFCMLGTNDSQRLDAPEGPLLVSPEETRRNLAELRARAVPDRDLSWVWLTPAPIDEERVARFPFVAGSGIGWRNDDLDRLARALPTGDDLVVDSGTAIVVDDPDALADDGLHPNPTAQETLAAQVLAALAKEAE